MYCPCYVFFFGDYLFFFFFLSCPVCVFANILTVCFFQGLKPVKALPVTIPESPALAVKNRVRAKIANSIAYDEPSVKSELKIVRAHPVPHQCIPFRPKPENKRTEIKPFSFDEKDRERFAKKEQQISKILEEEQKVFEKRITKKNSDIICLNRETFSFYVKLLNMAT